MLTYPLLFVFIKLSFWVCFLFLFLWDILRLIILLLLIFLKGNGFICCIMNNCFYFSPFFVWALSNSQHHFATSSYLLWIFIFSNPPCCIVLPLSVFFSLSWFFIFLFVFARKSSERMCASRSDLTFVISSFVFLQCHGISDSYSSRLERFRYLYKHLFSHNVCS